MSDHPEGERTWVQVPVGLHVKVLQPVDPRTFWPLVDLAVRTPRVLEALRHFLEPSSWDALYRAFETVELDVGSAMFKAGWVTEAEIKGFTHTANATFRHAKGRFQPPEKPMELYDARELIRRLLRKWVLAKLKESAG